MCTSLAIANFLCHTTEDSNAKPPNPHNPARNLTAGTTNNVFRKLADKIFIIFRADAPILECCVKLEIRYTQTARRSLRSVPCVTKRIPFSSRRTERRCKVLFRSTTRRGLGKRTHVLPDGRQIIANFCVGAAPGGGGHFSRTALSTWDRGGAAPTSSGRGSPRWCSTPGGPSAPSPWRTSPSRTTPDARSTPRAAAPEPSPRPFLIILVRSGISE